MGLLPSHQDDKADAVRTAVPAASPAAVPAAVPAAKLTPKGVISVTGKPSFANLLTFQVGCRTQCVAVQCVTMLPGLSAFTPERHGRSAACGRGLSMPWAGFCFGTAVRQRRSSPNRLCRAAGGDQGHDLQVHRRRRDDPQHQDRARLRSVRKAHRRCASRLMPALLTSVVSEQATPRDHTGSKCSWCCRT